MNNLVFNNIASQLKASIYAQNPSGEVQPIQIDSNGNLNVSITNSVTISNESLTVAISNPIIVANSITIANESITVGVANPITISNESLTVAVSNPITVANSITIANETLSVAIIANSFTSLNITTATYSGTGAVLNNTDISNLNKASFLVYNTGADTLTISLQLSPTTNEEDYITSPNNSLLTVAGNTSEIIPVDLFANYARLQYSLGSSTATFSTFFNGQA